MSGELPVTVSEGRKIFGGLSCHRAEDGKAACESVRSWETPPAAVEFKDVSLAYRSVKGGPNQIFDRLNLTVRKGEKIALIGSNGAGKSTLMKMMTGLLRPSQGEIEIFGEKIQSVKRDKLFRRISLVYQNPEEMFIKDTIESDIAYAMEVRNIKQWKERTGQLLEQFRLTGLKDRDGRLLSGGQMRRASLAIGIALNPEILLLDEPTANLDIATRREIIRTLEDMKDVTDTVMIATHDMQLVCEWAQRIIVLCGGKVIGDGTRNEIFGNEQIREMTGIRPPEIFSMGQELCPQAYCYTIDEFVQTFGGDFNGRVHKEAIG